MSSNQGRVRLPGVLLALPLLLGVSEKTDRVVLDNGDLLTCEIKKLERGLLQVKTDTMDTVEVRWGHVVELTSDFWFTVELEDGSKFVGSLASPSASGLLRIVTPAGPFVEVELPRVAFIYELEQSVLERIKGNLSLGFNFTKASEVTQLSLGFGLRARSERSQWNLSGNAISTSQPERITTQRGDLGLTYSYYLEDRWFVTGTGSLEHNDELGLDLRALASVGGGHNLVQSTSKLFSASAGLAVSREFNKDDENSNNLEGYLSLDYAWFLYDSPKLDLVSKVIGYPSITTPGRVRLGFSTKLRQEIVTDFFWILNAYLDHDSEPSAGAASRSDYGLIASLEYSW